MSERLMAPRWRRASMTRRRLRSRRDSRDPVRSRLTRRPSRIAAGFVKVSTKHPRNWRDESPDLGRTSGSGAAARCDHVPG
jgi:hypothetical protein